MKYLKTFESINTPEVNDLFGLWNRISIRGPELMKGNLKLDLDWDLVEKIEDHGYTYDYAASAIDKDGFEWTCVASVEKGSDNVEDYSEIEFPAEIIEKLNIEFTRLIRISDPDFVWESKPFKTVIENNKIINTGGNSILTEKTAWQLYKGIPKMPVYSIDSVDFVSKYTIMDINKLGEKVYINIARMTDGSYIGGIG